MKTLYSVASSVLSRTVLISDKSAAETFATEQTEHTGRPHTAEPVQVYDSTEVLNAEVDEAHRNALLPGLHAGQRRALGIKPPEAPKAAAPTAPEKPGSAKAT